MRKSMTSGGNRPTLHNRGKRPWNDCCCCMLSISIDFDACMCLTKHPWCILSLAKPNRHQPWKVGGLHRWWHHHWWHHWAVLSRETVGAVSLEQKQIWKSQSRLYIIIIVITFVKCLLNLVRALEIFTYYTPLQTPKAPSPQKVFFNHIWKNYKIGLEDAGWVWTNHPSPFPCETYSNPLKHVRKL